jgi:diguanylate cyclase (GGDEF)-like protein
MKIATRLWSSAIVVIATLLLFTIVETSALFSVERYTETGRQTRAVIRASDRLLSDLRDAETGQRGFLLTGRTNYLQPFLTAQQRLVADTQQLNAVTASPPELRAEAARLAADTDEKLAELAQTVELMRRHDRAQALAVVLSDRGQSLMDDARRLSAQIDARENALLAQKNGTLRATQRWTFIAMLAGGPIVAILIFLVTSSSAKAIGSSVRVLRERIVGINTGELPEGELRAPTDELSELAHEFDTTVQRLHEERAKRESAETALQRQNEHLTVQKRELEARTESMGLLRSLSYRLSGCVTEQEFVDVAHRFMPRLIPNRPGALFVFGNSRRTLTRLTSWNGETASAEEFLPTDCWALRRGHPHVVTDVATDIVCAHIHHVPAAGYVCAPLSAQGETLGIMYLEAEDRRTANAPYFDDDLSVLTETIALTLANVRLRESLQWQSVRDPLTGLFNRRYLEEAWQLESARALRGGNPIAVLMIDIDHFKRFNDRFGHEAGDTVLQTLAEVLTSNTRAGDVVCRWGGEEFLVMLVGSPLVDATKRAEVLRRAVKAMAVHYGAETLGTVTISVGVAAFPHYGTTLALVTNAADAALYRAKHGGRDRIEVANNDDVEPVTAEPAATT